MAQPRYKDKYVTIGSIHTRYWQQGGMGSPVVLIHGLGASVDIWMHAIDTLAQAHRVYALDLVGFGKTDKPDTEYGAALFPTFLNRFIRVMNIENATLIGNSLGGGIALQYALLYPHSVSRLVLVDSAGFGADASLSLRALSLPLVGELMTRPSRFEAYVYFRHAVHDPSVLTKEFIDTYRELHSLPGNQTSLLKAIRAILSFRGGKKELLNPILNNIHRIAAPTLIIWGRQDRVLPLRHAYTAKKMLPHSQLHILDSCGHMPQYERPEEFNRIVLQFLDM